MNGKTVLCKQVHLYVGYDRSKDNTFDYNWSVLTNNYERQPNEILFNPDTDNKSFYLCNIPLKDKKMFCIKDKSEIIDGQIIEMRYNADNPKDML